MKGFVLNTIEAYETKQDELSNLEGLGYKEDYDEDRKPIQGDKIRYAGRIKDGVTHPDLILKDETYFIPHSSGNVDIDLTTELKVISE